jgi:hypothetical protein
MATLPDISEYLHIKESFCHPDWDAISKIIEKCLPESEWNSAWEAASRSWVERIREKLGGGYQVFETANFMILSDAPMRVIKDACRSYEDSLKRVLASFEGVASDEGFGKHVVMDFLGEGTWAPEPNNWANKTALLMPAPPFVPAAMTDTTSTHS